ncbi:MAG: dihydroneopterin triphosphate 2'-epimerase [Pontibacterium sp.]
MSVSNAVIHITNLRLRTFIGFNPDEMTKQQDVVINIEIHYPAQKAICNDDVDAALNYKIITKKIIAHVEAGHFKLLEKLVSDLLELCTEHPWTEYAKVRVDKPHALRFADSVALSLEWHKDL